MTWKTFDGRLINVEDLEQQHLCNIYWYLIIFDESNQYALEAIKREILRRGSVILPYAPFAEFKEEITNLHKRGMVGVDGSIVFKGKTIGSLDKILVVELLIKQEIGL